MPDTRTEKQTWARHGLICVNENDLNRRDVVPPAARSGARHPFVGRVCIRITAMDQGKERRLLAIFRHLQAGENTILGLSAIADHWHGDSASFRATLERLLTKGLIEIRGEGYCITPAGKAAIS
jgi:hypothetical protein